ncbi:MAG: hypothetical protein PHU61_03550 [Candidatus Absconditabacteria bacterium]|nr:hypothetical protein [Candidatus Absconditabacteria bacterium]MDD3868384.1 hypothetical protein [Candidatus Absconditabacteria bacterium]MDD4714467.1 hypothetical protein [Candidatus Absconditabacteria bacterium]
MARYDQFGEPIEEEENNYGDDYQGKNIDPGRLQKSSLPFLLRDGVWGVLYQLFLDLQKKETEDKIAKRKEGKRTPSIKKYSSFWENVVLDSAKLKGFRVHFQNYFSSYFSLSLNLLQAEENANSERKKRLQNMRRSLRYANGMFANANIYTTLARQCRDFFLKNPELLEDFLGEEYSQEKLVPFFEFLARDKKHSYNYLQEDVGEQIAGTLFDAEEEKSDLSAVDEENDLSRIDHSDSGSSSSWEQIPGTTYHWEN